MNGQGIILHKSICMGANMPSVPQIICIYTTMAVLKYLETETDTESNPPFQYLLL